MPLNKASSIHLTNFPDYNSIPPDSDLILQMDIVRDICNAALSIRKDNAIRTRMPLKKMTIFANVDHNLSIFNQILADEVNVEEVVFSNIFAEVAQELISLNFKLCGKKLGKDLKKVMSLVQENKVKLEGNQLYVGDYILQDEEFKRSLKVVDASAKVCVNETFVVQLDLNVTDDLLNKGIVRDVVRFIQTARKDMNLNISRNVKLIVQSQSAELLQILKVPMYLDYLEKQTISSVMFDEFNDHQNKEELQKYSYHVDGYGDIDFFFA